ncbi:hypothetical protein T458_17310 [Brevibacillus panacihumi W25]|uniref:DUF2512 family protein n=1 Tax=Brevibacillus panacihumi W25 TaxID=1408254 RepID=V6M253_9BACL|nr:DUF2512 family protein [Brevibacillus panacihumi]EST52711.1 hypothetical protein T458_17310 [Brevibacillus panacihumi W25]HZG80329.1 DUF2512 family protein [Brevibacillus sp.]
MNILIKLVSNGIVAIPGLWWSGTSLAFAIVASVIISLIAYAIGDLLILPSTNNTLATTADFILVFALFWASCSLFNQTFALSGLLLTSLIIGVEEYFFHGYLQRKGVHHTKHPG